MKPQEALRSFPVSWELYYHGKEFPYYNNLNQYSKNKIHCSCPLCRGEVWGVGNNSIKQLTISDQKKMNSAEFQMNEIDAEE